jgi:5-methylcytosine-specific restriction endonuclease McrA
MKENGMKGDMVIIFVPGSSKRTTIPKTVKAEVWKRDFGDEGKGSCYCCGNTITALGSWEAGHIKASSRGGTDNIDNLKAVCSTCNKSMGTMDMDEFKHRYFDGNKIVEVPKDNLNHEKNTVQSFLNVAVPKDNPNHVKNIIRSFLNKNLETTYYKTSVAINTLFELLKNDEPSQKDLSVRDFITHVRDYADSCRVCVKKSHGAWRLFGYTFKRTECNKPTISQVCDMPFRDKLRQHLEILSETRKYS